MRITDNNGMFSVSFGVRDDVGTEREKKQTGKNLTIFVGDLPQNNGETAIENKRKEIREKAANVLLNKFERDLAQDETADESRAKIESAQADQKEAQERIAELRGYLENAPEDLDEETMQMYKEGIAQAQSELADAQSTVMAENAGIRSMKRARLGETYKQSMAYAADQEEKILAAGSKEIMGMAIQESMNHIDEMYEEKIEAAEEAQEKKEEQEEAIDSLKEKRQEMEQQIEAAKDKAAEKQAEATAQMNTAVTESSDVDKELQKIQKEAELLDEDLKGLMVDSQL